VGLSVVVGRKVEAELAVEGQRAGHVLDDDSDQVQLRLGHDELLCGGMLKLMRNMLWRS
jgi:hypothetical protein